MQAPWTAPPSSPTAQTGGLDCSCNRVVPCSYAACLQPCRQPHRAAAQDGLAAALPECALVTVCLLCLPASARRSQVAVASHTFKANNCANCEFGAFFGAEGLLPGILPVGAHRARVQALLRGLTALRPGPCEPPLLLQACTPRPPPRSRAALASALPAGPAPTRSSRRCASCRAVQLGVAWGRLAGTAQCRALLRTCRSTALRQPSGPAPVAIAPLLPLPSPQHFAAANLDPAANQWNKVHPQHSRWLAAAILQAGSDTAAGVRCFSRIQPTACSVAGPSLPPGV